jgi:hypothetical protein
LPAAGFHLRAPHAFDLLLKLAQLELAVFETDAERCGSVALPYGLKRFGFTQVST